VRARRPRVLRALAALAVAASLAVSSMSACAPAVPLLAGARTTPARRGDVLVGGAVRAPLGALRRSEQPSANESALLALGGRGGAAPVAATRVGLNETLDLGLSVAGGGANLALRLTVPLDDAGAGALLFGVAPGVRWVGAEGLDGAGFDADVYALVSRSVSGIYEAWAGLRAGMLAAGGTLTQPAGASRDISAFGVRAGAVVGLALGLKTFGGMFELAADYERYAGELGGRRAAAGGFSLTPAFALRVRL
jgi:hypothetical protein